MFRVPTGFSLVSVACGVYGGRVLGALFQGCCGMGFGVLVFSLQKEKINFKCLVDWLLAKVQKVFLDHSLDIHIIGFVGGDPDGSLKRNRKGFSRQYGKRKVKQRVRRSVPSEVAEKLWLARI